MAYYSSDVAGLNGMSEGDFVGVGDSYGGFGGAGYGAGLYDDASLGTGLAYEGDAYGGGLGGLGYGDGIDGGLGYSDDSGLDLYSGGGEYLWDSTSFLDREVPLMDAWGDDWAAEQYQLADLMYYSQQLATLPEESAARRFEERLNWEALADEERAARWAEMDVLQRQRLGLTGGWWHQRYGDPNYDLSYLRTVPLRRGLFPGHLRSFFGRHTHLRNRFLPLISPDRLHGFRGAGIPQLGRGFGYGAGMAQQRPIGYGSRPLSMGPSLRADELQTRLRLAETRASMTGLTAAARAQALQDARRIREQINLELRERQSIDRSIANDDALLAARDRAQIQSDRIRDIQAAREQARFANGGLGYGGMAGGIGRYAASGMGRPRSWGGF